MAAVGDVQFSIIEYVMQRTTCRIGVYHQLTNVSDPDLDPNFHLATTLAQNVGNLQVALSIDVDFCSVYTTTDTGDLNPPTRAYLVNIMGQRPGQAIPANNAAVLRFSQAAGGPRNDGRVYLSGISEDNTLGNNISDAIVTDGFLAWATQIRSLNAVTGDLVWAHVIKSQDTPGPPPTYVYYAVIGASASPIIYSQSRRSTKHHGAGN